MLSSLRALWRTSLVALSFWSTQPLPVLAGHQNTQTHHPSSWAKADHDLALDLLKNLDSLTERLDDCTSKGQFSNSEAVPDACNGAYVGATEAMDGRGGSSLVTFLMRGCAKWRGVPRSDTNRQDCENVGKGYWHLGEAINRSALANNNARERHLTSSLGDIAQEYIYRANPGEVSAQTGLLRSLNIELGKPQVNPGAAFWAGELHAELGPWVLNHCPTELAWGLAPKEYASASAACAALEPELRQFEENVLRVMALFPKK
jgi:hypothetical protein